MVAGGVCHSGADLCDSFRTQTGAGARMPENDGLRQFLGRQRSGEDGFVSTFAWTFVRTNVLPFVHTNVRTWPCQQFRP